LIIIFIEHEKGMIIHGKEIWNIVRRTLFVCACEIGSLPAAP